jgi:hypothetical protein
MATVDQAREALYELIRDTATHLNREGENPYELRAKGALQLAEALAWAKSPTRAMGEA